MHEQLQAQYDVIYRLFKTTCVPPYDTLEWDGTTLQVVLQDITIETYTHEDLCEIIPGFWNAGNSNQP